MLDQVTRSTILRLHEEGHGTRFIARALGVARQSVRDVIAAGTDVIPELHRPTAIDPHHDRVVELHRICRGNLVRVHEELAAEGIDTPYSTLTRYCRTRGIGQRPKKPVGRYHFGPGEEMQHDTSPHKVEVGGRELLLQCASLVMCYSRMRFIRCFRRWNRFSARVFLTEALVHFGGAAGRCMLDNSTVLMVGTGKSAVPVPEMAAFAKRMGDFGFVAHIPGDANRSARVERPFHHVENNFYPGRTFTDLADLNRQLHDWCERYNATSHRYLKTSPVSLFAVEQPQLKPLPAFVPEPIQLHVRKVDVHGFVTLHVNRYSVGDRLIGRQVEVHEAHTSLRVFDGPRLVVEHEKRDPGLAAWVTHPDHARRWRRKKRREPPSEEERALRAAGPALAALCDALRARHGGQARRTIRRLHRLWLDYPTCTRPCPTRSPQSRLLRRGNDAAATWPRSRVIPAA